VELSRSERSVLQCLVAANGEPVSRDALIVELGESLDTFDAHRLEMLVHRMRRKVAAASGESLPLRSVRGRGYVLTR
jgi:DNA-binding response OmpR family regulator